MCHYTMSYKYGKRTREFSGAFLFPFQSIISYPTRAPGIIVNYTPSLKLLRLFFHRLIKQKEHQRIEAL